MDRKVIPKTNFRLSREIARLYLIGDADGVGGIWLNRYEDGKIEPPDVTLRKIDVGEIYR